MTLPAPPPSERPQQCLTHGIYRNVNGCPDCKYPKMGRLLDRLHEGRNTIARCDEYARKGTGYGVCDRILDEHGNCESRAHVDSATIR